MKPKIAIVDDDDIIQAINSRLKTMNFKELNTNEPLPDQDEFKDVLCIKLNNGPWRHYTIKEFEQIIEDADEHRKNTGKKTPIQVAGCQPYEIGFPN